MVTSATLRTADASATLTLNPDQEPIRCTVCGLGADPGRYDRPAEHVVTTRLANGASRQTVPSDHDAVCDNIAPDGKPYPFGRITDTQTIGPYTITTVVNVNVDGTTETSYACYIDSSQVVADRWGDPNGGVRSTGASHRTIDEALAFCIAYRLAGPNDAWPISGHFIAGLSR